MNRVLAANSAKNIILLLILIYTYFEVQALIPFFSSLDPATVGDLVVAVSIIIVTACFGNFAFTYEKIDTASRFSIFVAHATTGLFMLIIGISLELTEAMVGVIAGSIPLFSLCLLLLYVACALYDFWDVMRLKIS